VPMNATGGMPVMHGGNMMVPLQQQDAQAMGFGYQQNRLPERRSKGIQNGRRTQDGSHVTHRFADKVKAHPEFDVGFESQELFGDCTTPENTRTTVMLRNLPNNYSRSMLLDLIDAEGFERLYDFIYLPIDFKSRASLGYAFVNLVNFEAANRFRLRFDGFSDWILPSRKVCGVSWSGPHQGLEAHIERYQNSPVMHEAVPDMYKPAIFKDGVRASFPPSNKKLRAPRIRHFHGPGAGFA